eukprot:TRINITY_DN61502_c0_g1_i1.p1 TRINITY_DN61502_c0_g1~~TRINITY_DN61502_c0_g1_i1.p1  ORF type:complete len:443 (-),score=47.42 TRINITY_DN61502_c0_g1_i1:4-1332(-)
MCIRDRYSSALGSAATQQLLSKYPTDWFVTGNFGNGLVYDKRDLGLSLYSTNYMTWLAGSQSNILFMQTSPATWEQKSFAAQADNEIRYLAPAQWAARMQFSTQPRVTSTAPDDQSVFVAAFSERCDAAHAPCALDLASRPLGGCMVFVIVVSLSPDPVQYRSTVSIPEFCKCPATVMGDHPFRPRTPRAITGGQVSGIVQGGSVDIVRLNCSEVGVLPSLPQLSPNLVRDGSFEAGDKAPHAHWLYNGVFRSWAYSSAVGENPIAPPPGSAAMVPLGTIRPDFGARVHGRRSAMVLNNDVRNVTVMLQLDLVLSGARYEFCVFAKCASVDGSLNLTFRLEKQKPKHDKAQWSLEEATAVIGAGKALPEFQQLCTRSVSYTHLRAHETPEHLVCRLLLEKKKKNTHNENPTLFLSTVSFSYFITLCFTHFLKILCITTVPKL